MIARPLRALSFVVGLALLLVGIWVLEAGPQQGAAQVPVVTLLVAGGLVLILVAIWQDRVKKVGPGGIEFRRGVVNEVLQEASRARPGTAVLTVQGHTPTVLIEGGIKPAGDLTTTKIPGNVGIGAGETAQDGEPASIVDAEARVGVGATASATGTVTPGDVISAESPEEFGRRLLQLVRQLSRSYDEQAKGILVVEIAKRGGQLIVTPEEIREALGPYRTLDDVTVVFESLVAAGAGGPTAIQASIIAAPRDTT